MGCLAASVHIGHEVSPGGMRCPPGAWAGRPDGRLEDVALGGDGVRSAILRVENRKTADLTPFASLRMRPTVRAETFQAFRSNAAGIFFVLACGRSRLSPFYSSSWMMRGASRAAHADADIRGRFSEALPSPAAPRGFRESTDPWWAR